MRKRWHKVVPVSETPRAEEQRDAESKKKTLKIT
jgi:hypothetical protein